MDDITLIAIIGLFMTGGILYAKKITFTKYPEFKLGFTTANFTRSGYGPTLANEIKFIDYACEQGYSWIEIRDANAVLTTEECQAIAAYAGKKNIEIAYAANRGPLDGDFWQVTGKAWKNASVFTKGPRSVRTLDGNTEFTADKTGWTETEFITALNNQNAASAGIKEKGLNLMVENANVPILGPYGLEAFFEKADPSLGFQLDTANMFAVSRVKTDPADAERVIRKLAPRIIYTHLKTSENGMQKESLSDNELDFKVIFEILAKNRKHYIAVEIAQVDVYEQQIANLEKSIEYLVKKGFVTIR